MIAVTIHAMIINARMKEEAIPAVKIIPTIAIALPMTTANGIMIGEIMKGEIVKGEIIMIGGETKTIAITHQIEEIFRMTHLTKI